MLSGLSNRSDEAMVRGWKFYPVALRARRDGGFDLPRATCVGCDVFLREIDRCAEYIDYVIRLILFIFIDVAVASLAKLLSLLLAKSARLPIGF
jgi:hypothetical protein